jgi:hypothetical protein
MEICANVSIVLLVLVLGAILLRTYFLPGISRGDTRASANRVSPGTKLSLNNVDFTRAEKTVLLALSKGCHFCSESAPFYQRVVGDVEQDATTQLFFLFPHSADDGKKYLNDLNIKSDQIRQVSFGSLEVTGTPTLILTDKSGVVTDVWVGKLQPSQEEDVLAKVKPCRDCN